MTDPQFWEIPPQLTNEAEQAETKTFVAKYLASKDAELARKLAVENERLRADRDRLLAAVKFAVGSIEAGWKLGPYGTTCEMLKAAIAAAEEQAK